MIQMVNTPGNIWHFKCPHCLGENSYNGERDSPFYCEVCDEELPEFSSITNLVEERVDYYKTSKEWLFGPFIEATVAPI